MQLDLFDFNSFFLAFVFSLFLHIVFLRKHIINYLDPWIILFLNQVMFLAVIIYFFFRGELRNDHFIYSIASWLAFVFGLRVFYTKKLSQGHITNLFTYRSTKVAIYLFSIIFLINASVIFYYLGVPFFTQGNTTVSSYSELGHGFGILFYLNWGTQSILSILAIKIWLYDKNKRLGLACLGMLVIFNLLNGGGKGAYLGLLMAINLGIYLMHKNYGEPLKLPRFFKAALILLPFLILGAFIGAVNQGYESNVFLALIRRLIGGAEGPYYYFIANSYSYFKGLNLLSYHLSNILPYFGIIDREAIDLGVNLTNYSDLQFGMAGHGPNPTMYVIGHIALNNFGIIYCFSIGLLLSYLRYRLKTSFIVWLYLNLNAITLVGDGTLMPLDMFYVLLLSPILILALIIAEKKIILR